MSEPIQPDKQLTPQTERALNSFFTNLTSEIRTPLTAIVGLSEVMLKYEAKIGPLSEKQKDYLTWIHKNGEDVFQMFDTLHDVFRLVYGYQHLPYLEEVNLRELIQQVISHTQVKIQLDILTNLPNIWADSKYIFHALSWLLPVARQDEKTSTTLAVSFDEKNVIFDLISVEQEGLYFYYHPDNPTLFFSRSIIEMHGGQLTVDVQEEQKRLEISFTLPIKRV